MAQAQPLTATSPMTRSGHLRPWSSYHIYYHESLDRVILQFIRPTVKSLLTAGRIDSFFFLRYSLGGPHVRLRLRARPRQKERVTSGVRQFAQEFLTQVPSTKPVPEETILRLNRFILASDLHESDGAAYPDNTFRIFPFHPEVLRYGGPELLPHSLDFFALSSTTALCFLSRNNEKPRSQQLVTFFCLLLRQALGFAADVKELLALLHYAVESWGKSMQAISEKGDRVFIAQRETLCMLFRRELLAASSTVTWPQSPDTLVMLAEGTRRLSIAIGYGEPEKRKIIGCSQMHMTASRLGLSNAEEVYVSRLLFATAQDLLSSDSETRSCLEVGFRDAWSPCRGEFTVHDLLPQAFAILLAECYP